MFPVFSHRLSSSARFWVGRATFTERLSEFRQIQREESRLFFRRRKRIKSYFSDFKNVSIFPSSSKQKFFRTQ
ncbi:hypothetical protein DLM75_11765 [Leptospira stimsonii]|uniref:Uncharacterized protein n=1 Tax=Leptospira stimsonii TaxID=2202203 RepID=A0A396Z2D9_9LEPT|nr:hypothetical protein DLM75_11765 [Leptospira stimsonii]